MPGRYADGVDEVDLICAAAPVSCLLMAGDSLASFKALLDTEQYTWPADAFLPQVLLHYDLPELATTLPCPTRIINPLDGQGNPLPDEHIAALNRGAERKIYESGSTPTSVTKALHFMLDLN